MTTVAERAARGEAVTPDLNNEWNCQPFLSEALAETLAQMSTPEQAMLTRSIIDGEFDIRLERFLFHVREHMQGQAHEIGNE